MAHIVNAVTILYCNSIAQFTVYIDVVDCGLFWSKGRGFSSIQTVLSNEDVTKCNSKNEVVIRYVLSGKRAFAINLRICVGFFILFRLASKRLIINKKHFRGGHVDHTHSIHIVFRHSHECFSARASWVYSLRDLARTHFCSPNDIQW